MKQIPLTQGKTAMVDDEDYEQLVLIRWHTVRNTKPNTTTWYARGHVDGKRVYMHRMVMNAVSGQQIDHRDHDGLNNSRSNLRLCTQAQNNGNARFKIGVSGYRGVVFYAPSGTWQARIMIGGKGKTLGYRRDPAAAARLYDDAARAHLGEFATVNFPADAVKA